VFSLIVLFVCLFVCLETVLPCSPDWPPSLSPSVSDLECGDCKCATTRGLYIGFSVDVSFQINWV
jgi:hypothetical protein